MLKVGFDISALDSSFKSHAHRGIGRYVRELKNHFDSQADLQNQVRLGFFDHTNVQHPRLMDLITAATPVGRQTLKQQLCYPIGLKKIIKSNGFDYLHFPAHMDAPSWKLKNYVLTVLDLIPLVCETLYRPDKPGWRFKLARWLEIKAIKNASLIIAISENTARDVKNLLGIPAERIFVTPLGVDDRFFDKPDDETMARVAKLYNIAPCSEFILYVGGIDQRKNMPGLIKAFDGVVSQCREKGEPTPILLMGGDISNDSQYPRLVELIREHGLEENVKLLGFLPEADLLAMFHLSTVFVFPSLYEGFGLPPLEAMASGLPVVSSNSSSMPETLSGAAVLVDPANSDLIAKEIYCLLRDSERRRDLAEKGKIRARSFSWRNTGEKTLAAYRQLLQADRRDEAY
jgi:glycosyltransferase involved in cell wall biosynthesis